MDPLGLAADPCLFILGFRPFFNGPDLQSSRWPHGRLRLESLLSEEIQPIAGSQRFRDVKMTEAASEQKKESKIKR